MVSVDTSLPAGPIDESDERYDRDGPVAQSPLQKGFKLREQAPDEICDHVHETTPKNVFLAWTMKCFNGTRNGGRCATIRPQARDFLGK